jgi:septal ring factor EnvC (AmiA/AmiB activator)
MTPRPEHRISAIEKRVLHVETSIEELASDTSEEFRVLTAHVDQGFDQAHAFVQERFSEINARFDKVEQRLDKMEGRLDRIEATQAEQSQKLDQILALLQQRPDK